MRWVLPVVGLKKECVKCSRTSCECLNVTKMVKCVKKCKNLDNSDHDRGVGGVSKMKMNSLKKTLGKH